MNSEQIFIVHPYTSEQSNALKAFIKALNIKFEIAERPYNPDFVTKILESEKQIIQGKTKKVKKEELKQFLGL